MERNATKRPDQTIITRMAPAKINLTLEVLGKRPDGYHEVATLLHTIDLCDIITFKNAANISLLCNHPGLLSEDNLVLRAARLLSQAAGSSRGAAISLRKHIPQAAGLGGGSSDAATTLRGLNSLWGLGLHQNKMAEMAAALGSDVPFFVFGGIARADGRGEKVTPLPVRPNVWLVLLIPDVPAVEGKTAQMYASLHKGLFTDGGYTDAAATCLLQNPMVEDLEPYNVFERTAPDVFPGLSDFKSKCERAAGATAHLAGSGPAMFILCRDRESAAVALRMLHAKGINARITHSHYGEEIGDQGAPGT